jgi:outer membrane protein OmpA-like peptidoglycan-associated protein
VLDALHSIPGNWHDDAQFSVDLEGTSTYGDIELDQSLNMAYEAALPGYLTYLHISSHGDMTLFRGRDVASSSGTSTLFVIKPPLGLDHLIVLFSNQPLDMLFPINGDVVELGAESKGAVDFVERLAKIEASNVRIATRMRRYMVVAKPGGTQYLTRSILREVERAGRQSLRKVSRVEFEFNSDRLTDQGKLDLDIFGEVILEKGRRAILEGYTDAIGTEAYNMDLSWRRAEAVKQYLVNSFGISASSLKTIAKGMSNPLAPNDTEEHRSQNRRVEFSIFGADAVP